MSASMGANVFPRIPLLYEYSLFNNYKFTHRHFLQLQQVRGEARSTRPRPWHVRKKAPIYAQRKDLTPDNVEFLEETALDRFSSSPLKEAPVQRNEYTMNTRRCGVLAIKIGVQPQWTKDGKKFTTTLLQVLDNHVINYIPPEQFATYPYFKREWQGRGMQAVGALSCDPGYFTKEYNNLFAKAGIPPKRKLTRFIVSPDAVLEPGTPLNAMHFKVGNYIDAQAKTIGHGFQGVVKRWGFKGGPATHGTTKWHRRPGSIGCGGDKGNIWKGKKMPGHMGMSWRTLKGLRIWRINTKYNVLYVMGQNLPGPTHCYMRIMDSSLPHRKLQSIENGLVPPMPTWYEEDDEMLEDELFHEDLFQFTQPSITFDQARS